MNVGRLPIEVVDKARNADCLETATRLGFKFKKNTIDEWIGACPGCGGDDRFSISTDKNVFNCGHQGGEGGDAIALWQHVTGDNFVDAVVALTNYIPDNNSNPPKPQAAPPIQSTKIDQNPWREKARKNAYNLFNGARPANEIIRRYFDIRAIKFPDWKLRYIREIPSLDYWHNLGDSTRKDMQIVHSGPAMVAAIIGDDGKFMGIHRTWLDFTSPNGRAEIFCPNTGESLDTKKVMGSQKGGHIVIREPHPNLPISLIIGEGIETILSFDILNPSPNSGLWSGVNLGNIAGRAESRISHPTMTYTDKRMRVRKRLVPSDNPKLDDDSCLRLRGNISKATFLGDGDSDLFNTRNAMRRAHIRAVHDLQQGAEVSTRFSQPGGDFNDQLRAVQQPLNAQVEA